ncbi:MAG: hypothetical protein IAG13_06340 [Deltaproteobacteria bacterium]|nr:hypothetical protein [Nannocystaceae bacterium]
MPSPLLPRTRSTTWIAALCLAAGAHAGVLVHELFTARTRPGTVVISSVTTAAPVQAVTPAASPLARCASERVCVIDRDALADAFADRDARLLRSVRALPVEGGLELSGIRRGGLLGRVGLRNGDVLTQVDGHPLRDGDDVEVLLARAQHGSFRLVYRRDDRVLSKRFELVESATLHTSTAKAPA